MKHIVAKETDIEEWNTSCRAEQCCMIIYDLYFTVVDVGDEIRLRVSLQDDEHAYLDFIRRNKEFEVVRRKNICDAEYWRIRFYVEHNLKYLRKDMKTDYYIVDKMSERQPIPMKPEEIEKIKKDYPKNTVVMLTEDLYSDGVPEKDMYKGLTGKVSFVDDAGQIHVKWQNGRGLAIIPGVDNFQKVDHFIKACDLLKAAFERLEEDNNEGRPSFGYFEEHYKVISAIEIDESRLFGNTYRDTSVCQKELEKQVISGYWVFTHSGHDGDFSARCLLTYEDAYHVVSHLILQDKGVEGMGVFTDIIILHDTDVMFYLSINSKDQVDFVDLETKSLGNNISIERDI